ncbi:MAG: O-succinylbenzoic acid--CoA ligase, partial [Muribaculaceae bacterium]|nr:O-succinylbenzoic acid--CoA ligase [Muribaculaceae bacterium]
MTYDDFIEEWNGGAAYIKCHTSGSTGKPTDILLPRTIMEESARRTCRYFGIGPESVLYSCISPDFIGGKMMAVRAEEGNLRLTWENPS